VQVQPFLQNPKTDEATELSNSGAKHLEGATKTSEILSQELSDQGMFSEHEYHLLSKEEKVKVD